MSSSSLIFSMEAISMKVNPAFVSILIIASSLVIHLSTYIQPSHRFWAWAPFMVLTPSVWGVSACRHEMVWTWTHIMVLTPSPEVSPSVIMRRSDLGLISWSSHLLLRCLRLSSWDDLNMDSYHGPHTFCLRCLCLSPWDGLILGSFHGLHTFSWGVSARRHAAVCTWAYFITLIPSVWGVSARHHTAVWIWAHIVALTPSVWGVSARHHPAVWI